MPASVNFEISATETKKKIRKNMLVYMNACQVDNILYLDTKYYLQEDTT